MGNEENSKGRRGADAVPAPPAADQAEEGAAPGAGAGADPAPAVVPTADPAPGSDSAYDRRERPIERLDFEIAEAEAALPLAGVRVVITRPAAQAEGLCAAFATRGAVVERLPLLQVTAPDDPAPLRTVVAALPRYRWVAFTSANAVHPVAALLAEAGTAWPPGLKVAAVGRATREALVAAGVEPALVGDSGGTALADALRAIDPGLPGSCVLLPQAADARPELAAALLAAGVEVHGVVAYDKRLPPDARDRAAALFLPTATLGWVTFTSPRIAEAFAALIDDLATAEGGWPHRRLSLLAASLGPTTSTALRNLGVEPSAEADQPSDEELTKAVIAAVAGTPGDEV